MNQNGETFVRGQSPRAVTLTMRQGPGAGQRFVVSQEQLSIGRSPDNDVSIADQQVSRHHATIIWESNQFVIRDLNSANGTTVNGTALVGPCPLRDGDVIGFGDVMLTFQGTTGMTDHGGSETYVRPSPPSAVPPPVQPGTVAMPQQSGGRSALPILIGAGAAIIVGLAIVIGLILFFTSQSQSQTGPRISIQQPPSGAQVPLGQPMSIVALIKDPKGITRVELWVDNKLVDTTASNVPGGQEELLVQQSWTPNSGGTHTISLQAFNADGEMSRPAEITINVVGSDQGGTPGSTPTVPVVVGTGTPAACANNATFVADVTVPDNSVFPPGGRIDKIWRLRNSGTCPWQSGYQLIFVSGDKMGAPDGQAIVPTAPNGTTDVTVTMYAPATPGVYKGVWRMVNNTGQQFGQNITIVVQVPSPDTPTATVTATSPAPAAPVAQISADSENINAGDCTMIRASVQNVTAAWLDGEPIVGGYKEKQVCPCNDTTYNLEAVPPSGPHLFRSVTVNVTGICAANKPDLVVKELTADDVTPLKGNPVNFQMRIKNQGGTVADDFAAAWRPFGPGTTTWIIVEDNITLNPGEDRWINWSYTYADADTYDSKGVVDYLNNVDESNEGNNHRNLTIEVKSLLLPGPGILTAIAPGPIVTVNPGILTAIAPQPTFQLNPGILTAVAPGFATIVIPGP